MLNSWEGLGSRTWLKPHLAPLFSWSAVTAAGTVCRLPDTVILTLQYIYNDFKRETFLLSALGPQHFQGEHFRTDAKCTDEFVFWLAGKLALGGGSRSRWDLLKSHTFSNQGLEPNVRQLLQNSLRHGWHFTCLVGLGRQRRGRPEVSLVGVTDNVAIESLTAKRSTTTKWPLMGINMLLSSSLSRARLSLGLR